MDMRAQVDRLEANYRLLVTLYKQGKFEEPVRITSDPADLSKFYDAAAVWPLTGSGPDAPLDGTRGRMRHPNDLQWAARNLRESARALLDDYQNLDCHTDYKKVALYYLRSVSLSYEVDDYFLSVGDDTSRSLITQAKEITGDIEAYAARFTSYCAWEEDEYRELLKQILIVCLCGVNEYYRRHNYDEGLKLARHVQQTLREMPRKLCIAPGRWRGLTGLCSYVAGKILTAQGNYVAAEQEFLNSVEAYSESIWQKERNFFREYQEMLGKAAAGEVTAAEFERYADEHADRKRGYEMSRAVALRRSGLASTFGYGFQALVMGKVKDAIRLSSLSRGVVNWNTGKIYSAYVDLIYFSAKRAENSSDRKALLNIQRNLKRCYRVFEDLIPAAHYKYRVLFQISLVYHYLARWYRESGMALTEGTTTTKKHRTREWNLRKSEQYWNWAGRHLLQAVNDEGISANKRLRVESMAILAHAWSNLGLLRREFGRDGGNLLRSAADLLDQAWNEANHLPQSLCEVGLAKGAIGRAAVEYLLSQAGGHEYLDETEETGPRPRDEGVRDEIRSILDDSRRVLHEVIRLNQSNSRRVEATAYLRLTELALSQKEAWSQAREYFEEFRKISSQVEHEFCHRWARDLERKLLKQGAPFVVVVTPGATFIKQKVDKDLEKYYTDYAVNSAAKEIEEDLIRGGVQERRSLSSYLTSALFQNFGIGSKTAGKWINEYSMFDHLLRICPRAKEIQLYAPQAKKTSKKKR